MCELLIFFLLFIELGPCRTTQHENRVKGEFILVTNFIFKCPKKETNSSEQGENYFCGIHLDLWNLLNLFPMSQRGGL